ncbi:MAG: gamma-glutamylcyclotransferase [Aestuariivirgaceae bacterium]|nr:gamma-glutamylcyclotransferase [Aestuariivirgaceae bacterium]
MQEFWVFGYGSLMWRPGFAHEDKTPALLHGMSRRLCVYSYVHRGTEQAPGLVLGLDRGGACHGVAFRVRPRDWDEVVAYLRAREQVTNVYVEARRQITLRGHAPRKVEALTYHVDRTHQQYAGVLPVEEQRAIVRRGVGQSGPNPEYILNTLAHLREMGIRDGNLEKVAAGL